MEEKDERYAIHEAARKGNLSLVESLLNALPKANPALAKRRDRDDRLPIHWATSNSHKAIVDLLVQSKGYDADAQDGSGWSLLMIASSLKEGDDLVDLFLRTGADVNMKNFNGQTALHFCSSKNNLSVARTLVGQGASARIKDKRGQLALHRAAAIGSVPILQLLLKNKSPVNATDGSRQTALHHAISEGHGDAAMLLIKEGAETNKKDADDHLAIELAPDKKVFDFIKASADREGFNLEFDAK